MARNGNRKTLIKYGVIIASAVMFSFMGVSYAYWNDNLRIKTTMTTGSINPVFCFHENEDYAMNIKIHGNEKGNIFVSFPRDENGTRKTMVINGTVEKGFKADIKFCVLNDGTVPIKAFAQDPNIEEGLLNVRANLQNSPLEAGDHFYNEPGNGNPKVLIDVKGSEPLGDYEFTLKLPFKQWKSGEAAGYGGWEKELTIQGSITVVETFRGTNESAISDEVLPQI